MAHYVCVHEPVAGVCGGDIVAAVYRTANTRSVGKTQANEEVILFGGGVDAILNPFTIAVAVHARMTMAGVLATQ